MKEIKRECHIPLLGIYPKELKAETQRDTCTSMFLMGLFTIAKRKKKFKCPPMGEWINKLCICTMEYYSALKRKEVPIHAATWMNFEDITLIEMSQKRTNIVRFRLHEIPRIVKFIQTESRMVVTRRWRRGDGELIV